jgi:hypothetical protein
VTILCAWWLPSQASQETESAVAGQAVVQVVEDEATHIKYAIKFFLSLRESPSSPLPLSLVPMSCMHPPPCI